MLGRGYMKRTVWKLGNLRQYLPFLSVIFAVFGAILLVFFLRNVENGAPAILLFSGAVLLGLGNALAFLTVDDYKVHFFFVLYITTFFLLAMYDIRFGVMQGSDITLEYTSAKITVTDGNWLLSRADQGERYFSSVSVSLIPAVMTKITGLDLMPLFQWVMRLIIAILPIVVFMAVKEIFRNVKLAALSALIFSQLYFNFNLLTFLVRQALAEIFLILTIFLLVRLHKTKSNSLAYAILLTFSMFGIVISHYTLNYWSIIMIVGIFTLCFMVGVLPKKLLSWIKIINLKMEKPIINIVFLTFFIVSTGFWIYFTNLTSFLIDIHDELYLLSPNVRVALGSSVSQSSWILNNPAGPIVGFWFDATALLIPVGFLYVSFKMPKRSRHMPWLGGGLVMLAAMAFWVVAGSRALGLYLDRIYVMGAPFFTAFAAIPLLLMDRKLKILVILFLLFNLPLNMVLPSYQRYVLYRPEELVSPKIAVIQRIIRIPEFTASVWLDRHANKDSIFYTDFIESWFYARYRITFATPDGNPANSTNTYFVLHYYNLKYCLWQGSEEFPVDSFLNNCSISYSNGEAAIAIRR
jgi:uncharacterized membrane protein